MRCYFIHEMSTLGRKQIKHYFFYLLCSYLLYEFVCVCVCSSSIYWCWGHQSLATFLKAASRLLNSSHFLLEPKSMPIFFLMNLSVHFSLDTWAAPWCTSRIMSWMELACLVRRLRLCFGLLTFLLSHGSCWGRGHG